MPHSAYPTADDLTAFLQQTGLSLTGTGFSSSLAVTIDAAAGIAAGIGRFEHESGRRFLSANPNELRKFDPPVYQHPILDLRDDLCALVSVTSTTNTLILDTDYRLMPTDAPGRSLPWNRIEFGTRYYPPLMPNLWGAIGVTGTWAYGLTIPDDAWQGMLYAAAIDRLPMLITLYTGGLIGWNEADVSEQYGPRPFVILSEMWLTQMTSAAARYRRVAVGF